jgi:hypothetical protein
MKNKSKRILALGALLATSLAPAVRAEAEAPEAPETPEEPQESKAPPPLPPNAPHYAAGYLAIGSDFYNGKSTKAELDARVAAMHTNRNERRADQQRGLKNRWGARLLLHPDCREELRLHARRLANLTRALFLAYTDPSVKQRAELVSRLEGIMEREEDRHTKAMEKLRATLPDAATPAAPTPPPASASAPAGGK